MALLIVHKNGQIQSKTELQHGTYYTVGRKDSCDIVLDQEPGISRKHIEFEYTQDHMLSLRVLSENIPVLDQEQQSVQELETNESFQLDMAPYQFEFVLSPMENDLEENHGSEEESALSSSLNGDEEDSAPKKSVALARTDDSQTFFGNEEETSEFQITGEPYLKFMQAGHSESIRLKGSKWTAGRDSLREIVLDDKNASRSHFSIEKVGNDFFITDLESANGTLLNAQELPKLKKMPLKSGDIVTVGGLTMIFELRDLSFSNKIQDLPLQAYGSPMILTSDNWDSAEPPALPGQSPGAAPPQPILPGTVEKVPKKKNNRVVLMMGVVAVLALYFIMNPGEKKMKAPVVKSALDRLSPEQKQLVMETYNFAQNLYRDDRFQSALTELTKLHKIIPFYKDSMEMQANCEEAIKTIKQMEFINEQRRIAEQTQKEIVQLTNDCILRYQDSTDLVGAQTCLSKPLQLNPDNPRATQLTSLIKARLEQQKIRAEQKEKYDEAVKKGSELYTKAQNIKKSKDWHKAISAYSAHMNSNYPDPKKLKRRSKRNIASIKSRIRGNKLKYMGQALEHAKKKDLKMAILFAEKAKKVDPYDAKIPDFIFKHRQELTQKMRKIYTDSVIEEKFGNLQMSAEHWKKIIDQDLPSGGYYLKAKRKLQEYGL